jgi:hypothetical protein
MDQVTNGVAVRMAVLFLLVNRAQQTGVEAAPQQERPARRAAG